MIKKFLTNSNSCFLTLPSALITVEARAKRLISKSAGFIELKKFKYNNLNKLIIIESAILFETGIYLQNEYNILVKAPLEDRINRVMNRDKVSKVYVLKRINSQWSDSKKMDLAL